MSDPPDPGSEFQQDVKLDKPGIVGARWWQQSLVAEGQSVRRREILKGLAIAGGVMGVIGVGGYTVARMFRTKREQVLFGSRKALEVQRQYGWDFGARGEALVFDGSNLSPFVRTDLARLAEVMTPRHNGKYHVATLVESLFATPTAELPEPADDTHAMDTAAFRPLAEVLTPVMTPAMEKAYRAGKAFAKQCEGHSGVAALADMPGPEAVAFAAGAAGRFEPVLLFDNWPHPRAVVPSHLTLAALAYYQPLFAEKAAARTGTEPLFLLDRARLNPYSEEGDRFDNRYFAGMPMLKTLSEDGIRGLFYVVASPSDLPEPGDLNRTLAEGSRDLAPGKVAVRALAVSDFDYTAPTNVEQPAYYGGSPETDGSFWVKYPFDTGYAARHGQEIARTTTADHSFTAGAVKAPPAANLGKIAVLVTASGLLLGAALDRRGSMNRFAGGWAG